MRKILVVVAAATMALLLAACGHAAVNGPSASRGGSTATPAAKASCSPAPCAVEDGITVAATIADDNVQPGEYDTTPDPGDYYVLIDLTFSNGGSSAEDINPFDFKLQDATGAQHDQAFVTVAACQGFDDESLAPGAHVGPLPDCFEATGQPGGKLALIWQADFLSSPATIPLN